MKTKFLLTLLAIVFCSALFSSCTEEQVAPATGDTKTHKGVERTDDGF
jgi:hypothetical protein